MKFPAEVLNNLRNEGTCNLLDRYKLDDHVTMHVTEMLIYILEDTACHSVFKFLTAVLVSISLCRLVYRHQNFGVACCLRLIAVQEYFSVVQTACFFFPPSNNGVIFAIPV
jgi:hypothetical protein